MSVPALNAKTYSEAECMVKFETGLLSRKNIFSLLVAVSFISSVSLIALYFYAVVSVSHMPLGAVTSNHIINILFASALMALTITALVSLCIKTFLWYTDTLPVTESGMTGFHVLVESGLNHPDTRSMVKAFIEDIDQMRGFPVNGDIRQLKKFYREFEPQPTASSNTEAERIWKQIKTDSCES